MINFFLQQRQENDSDIEKKGLGHRRIRNPKPLKK